MLEWPVTVTKHNRIGILEGAHQKKQMNVYDTVIVYRRCDLETRTSLTEDRFVRFQRKEEESCT